MLCIAAIKNKVKACCIECSREIDLSDGGLYFHKLVGTELCPVCPWCAAKEDPVLAMCGAIYARAAEGYNREFPHERFNIALLDALTTIEEELLPADDAEPVDA
jgi:hypothetical protein